MTRDHNAAAEAHDALWAALWNRRFDDVDEAVWMPEAAYSGILAFARAFPEGTSLTAVDTGEALVVVRGIASPPPIGSRVRILPATRDHWKLGDGVQALGLGIDLRFDDHATTADTAWIGMLREGLRALREALDLRRDQLAAKRATIGGLNEPPTLEDIWREELGAISDRVQVETEYTPEEHAALAKAQARGPRYADEEERRIVAARRKRFTERGAEAVQRFRDEVWPAMRDNAIAETKKYEEYRSEVIRLEDALQRVRTLHDRAMSCTRALDSIEKSGFRVATMKFEPERVVEPAYAEELLRTIELLHAAIPQRAQSLATSFSAYRAPTAGPSVVPPRL